MHCTGIKLLSAVLLLCAVAHLTGCGSQGAAQPAAPAAGSDTGPAGPFTHPSSPDGASGGLAALAVRPVPASIPHGGQAGLARAVRQLQPDTADWEPAQVLHLLPTAG